MKRPGVKEKPGPGQVAWAKENGGSGGWKSPPKPRQRQGTLCSRHLFCISSPSRRDRISVLRDETLNGRHRLLGEIVTDLGYMNPDEVKQVLKDLRAGRG